LAGLTAELAAALLTHQLGSGARFYAYERDNPTPMSFLLDEAERQVEEKFTVYWVDDGPPESFTLKAGDDNLVVFSTRQLSVTALIRDLLVQDALSGVLTDVTERTCLKLMAEVALRSGDVDFAAVALAKSLVAKTVWLDDGDRLMELERAPIGAAYMTVWFYALAHEIGHLSHWDGNDEALGGRLSPASMQALTRDVIESSFDFPVQLREEAYRRAAEPNSGSVLEARHLASEALADLVAASILLQATVDITRKIGADFDIRTWVMELALCFNTLSIFDRCSRTARLAGSDRPSFDEAADALYQPVAVHVRAIVQNQYLAHALAHYDFHDDATDEQIANADAEITSLYRSLQPKLDKIEKGMASAMRFAFFPEERPNEWQLIDDLRKECLGDQSTLTRRELNTFLELAAALGKRSKLLDAIHDILTDPTECVVPDFDGDTIFYLPWVEGPGGFSRPFGLDTKHGHLIFAFTEPGPLYENFFRSSAEALKPGYSLERAAVPVSRPQRLGAELAARMPAIEFRVIVEGTETFHRYMAELAADTIWDG
jgi:hypothetical protein